METKICGVCNVEYPIEMFRVTPKGHSYQCKECDSRFERLKSGDFENIQLEIINNFVRRNRHRTKICTCCGYTKPLKCFRQISRVMHRGVCLKCKDRTTEEKIEAYNKHYDEYESYCSKYESDSKEDVRNFNVKHRALERQFQISRLKEADERRKNGYASSLLVRSGFPKESITQDLIDFKRVQIQLKREIKRQENGQDKVSTAI